jgi:6-phosphogluconolactonase (cycloisomerase 2 family)
MKIKSLFVYILTVLMVIHPSMVLAAPYDISTATFSRIALNVANEEGEPRQMLFNNDGTRLYVIGPNGDDINEYTLSTPYDISTGTFSRIALVVKPQEDWPNDMMFNNDGTKLYVMGQIGDDINEYTLSTPYDISTGTFSRIALSVGVEEQEPFRMLFNNDGTRLYDM